MCIADSELPVLGCPEELNMGDLQNRFLTQGKDAYIEDIQILERI